MLVRMIQATGAALCCAVMLANTGCGECARGTQVTTVSKPCKTPCGTPCGSPCGETKVTQVVHKSSEPCLKPAGESTAELPPNAKPGECYAKVFVPPEFKTVSERIMVKEASERIEIVPAKYEWIEERVCVKDASTRLVEVPAEYADREVTVQTANAHTDWEVNKNGLCELPANTPAKDVFCLVNYPAEKRTLSTRCLVKPARVVSETVPAQYETVRREKLVSAATTRKICIPAEYENVEKTVKVCDGRMAWKQVECEFPNDSFRESASVKTSKTTITTANTPRTVKTVTTVSHDD